MQFIKCSMVETAISIPRADWHASITQMLRVPMRHFVVVCRNACDRVVTWRTISIGTLDTTLVHPREVFRHAIKVNAAGVI